MAALSEHGRDDGALSALAPETIPTATPFVLPSAHQSCVKDVVATAAPCVMAYVMVCGAIDPPDPTVVSS